MSLTLERPSQAVELPPVYIDALYATHVCAACRLPAYDRITCLRCDGPLERVRYRVPYGGRGSAKSWSIARALVTRAFTQTHLILCTREFQNSIADSVYRVVETQIGELGLRPWFDLTQTSIKCTVTGSEFIFKGLRRNINEIRSLEGVTICWIEEAHSTSKESWIILDPTLRRGTELYVSYNPDSEEDPTHVKFVMKPPPDAIVIKTSWRDNPWFPPDLERLRQYMLANDPTNYDWVWEGETRLNTEATIFRGKAFVETFDDPPSGTRFYHGLDFGFSVDPTCLIRCWVKSNGPGNGEDLMVDREAYGYGIEIDEMPAFFERTVETARGWPIKADNARPETISYLSRQGFSIEAATKWQGSVEDGIAHLKAFRRIVIHERLCPNTARDFRLYRFKVDQRTQDVLPTIEDKNNHAPDSLRYALDGLIQMRGGLGVWLRLVK